MHAFHSVVSLQAVLDQVSLSHRLKPSDSSVGPRSLFLGIVLYNNSRREIERLFRSIEANRGSPGETALHLGWLDNSPTESLLPELKALVGPSLLYQHSEVNLGFGTGHNRLMEYAFRHLRTDVYVCVNPDSILHPDCLMELLVECDKEPRAGLVEARLFPDEHPKSYEPDTHETAWCTGCVLLISHELFDAIGGFDENFFLYCEDVDLSWRARAAGFSTRLAPAALVYHHAQGRPLARARELAVRRSAIYLGAKYGAGTFAAQWLKEYERLGGERFQLPPLTAPSPAMRKAADFKHLLHLAEPRW